MENQNGSENLIFCSNCGEKISRDAIVCPHCGVGTEKYRTDQAAAKKQEPIQIINTNNVTSTNTNVNTNTNTNVGAGRRPRKSKMTALLLCIFFGYLGVHRFYVGKTGTGILYLLTFGLCCIGWIVDIAMIITGSFRDQYGNKLR